ncbi:hypothetical protein [Natronolimnobius baerhuensis]|uniref:Uncharacterized protein n=1 Tax=Natronolimnobius baerhuensis TaxID=253108 RepID=A0A202E4M7_9EURY|nr:hypothetical protein [Natronolimnobius baerhuensis]OVE83181.1 hypothetical protein B2G88_17385 [Natronolimnobius baerhuensis]
MTVITAGDLGDATDEEAHIQAERLESERARATVEPQTRAAVATDGGEPDYEFPQLDVGDHVTDREDQDATMLVVNLDTLRADAYELESGPTVADVNPDYPADDDVVEVVFPQRTDVTLEALKPYAYPRSRLQLETPIHDRDDDDGGEE